MTDRKRVTQARLKELMAYDPQTGLFTRTVSCGVRAPAGSIAGSLSDGGYIIISVDYVKYRAHRLAWLYVTGEWPEHEIDHENTVRHDNRWDNLRDATPTMNRQNMRRARSDSKTGLLGASWSKREQKFVARIKVNGVYRGLGQHDTAEAAHAAYVTAKRALHAGCTI